MTKTEEFQRIFKELLNKEDFEDFDKIEKLINDGADINKEFEYDDGFTDGYIKGTPLYHSILKLKDTELAYFLISKDVIPDICSIRQCICMKNLHLLEELLKRFDFDKFINYDYFYILSDSRVLEVFLGFINFENTTISYNFSYIKNGSFYDAKYIFFAIEYIIISYITEKDCFINDVGNKKEMISMLKKCKNTLSIEKINEFISTYCDYESNQKIKKRMLDRFDYIYKYWLDL